MMHLFQELRRKKLAHELTDADLLERHLTGQDRDAFETLLHRHGPMVLGVCRRHLRDPATVDDAFQATFLVLLRSAKKIRNAASLGSWLHGVAVRTAQAAIRLGMNRQRHESAYAALQPLGTPATAPTPAEELGPWLDEELRRLPKRLRQPLVLCYLEGLTKPQAARRLGLPEGTVSSRLTRAREKLRVRLVRRGHPSAIVLAAFVAPSLGEAAVPAILFQATSKLGLAAVGGSGLATGSLVSASVTSLGDQVMSALAIAKFKFVSLLVATGLLAGTGGTMAWHAAEPGSQEQGTGGAKGAMPASTFVMKLPVATRTAPVPMGANNAANGVRVLETAHASPQEVRSRLNERTEKFANGLDPLPLEEHLNFIGKAFDLGFIVDERAFQGLSGHEAGKAEVSLKKMPRVSLATVLDHLLSQIEPPATFVVRGDHIAILPKERVESGELLKTSVNFNVTEGQTLERVLRDLADQHGVTILLDARCKEKGRTPIEGNFRNVNLDVAVRLLAEMAGLKAVTVGNAMFVTEAAHAYVLQNEAEGLLMPPFDSITTGTTLPEGLKGQGSGGGIGLGGMNPKAKGAAPTGPVPVPTKEKGSNPQ